MHLKSALFITCDFFKNETTNFRSQNLYFTLSRIQKMLQKFSSEENMNKEKMSFNRKCELEINWKWSFKTEMKEKVLNK